MEVEIGILRGNLTIEATTCPVARTRNVAIGVAVELEGINLEVHIAYDASRGEATHRAGAIQCRCEISHLGLAEESTEVEARCRDIAVYGVATTLRCA